MKRKMSAFWVLLFVVGLFGTTGCNVADEIQSLTGGDNVIMESSSTAESNDSGSTSGGSTTPKKDTKKDAVKAEETSFGDLKSRFGGDKRNR